jgi:agmatine/peptidylarginine deiminase
LLLLAASLLAESQESEKSLPIGFTAEELTRLNEIGINHTRTSPPNGDVRNVPEWERSQGVIIRWPLGLPVSLVAAFSQTVKVTTIVANSSTQASAISSYTAGGVNLANCDWLFASTNSYWTRDYGPWFIFDSDGDLAIVDPIYNRPRPLDDVIPQKVGLAWGLSVYGFSLNHTGGNHMCDGLGMSMSSRLVYEENPTLTPHQVDSMMFAYLGNQYTVLDYVESGGIHHIDCSAKLLDPTTILVKDSPVGSESHNALNECARILSEQMGPYGRPYTVVRVYCPTGTAYTNSIILNNKVFVPTFSSAAADSAALNVYRAAMPGYQVLPFNGSWLDDDAIHCRAMGVPDSNMLYIRHVPLFDTGDTLGNHLVGIHIHDHSDAGLIMDSLKIFYNVTGGGKASFLSTPLYSTADPDSFYGYIPAQNGGTSVSYFIQSADLSGRVETHPFMGALGAHRFRINMAPQIVSEDSLICRGGSTFGYYPQIVDGDDSVHQITYIGYPAWMTVRHDSLVGVAPDSSFITGFTVRVSDEITAAEQPVGVWVYLCGDADRNGMVNISDAVSLISYIFSGGPAPDPLSAGDGDCNDMVNITDAVYLISYIFSGGAQPCATCP